MGAEVADCVVRATFAKLIDHFHLKPWEIRRLTDRQLVELYFHPRTKDAEIEPVEEKPKADAAKPPTLNGELMEVDLLVANRVITKAAGERTKAKLRAKYAGLPIPTDEELNIPEAVEVIRGDKL